MDVITMESAVYDNIMAKLDNFEKELKNAIRKANYPLSERWLDTETLCKIFNCSKRTIQMYRDEQMLPYSQIKGRMYYRASDVEKFLNKNLKINRENGGRRRKSCK